jgi:hypothetical protein
MNKTGVVCAVVLIILILILSILGFVFYQPKKIDVDNFDLDYSIYSDEEETIIVAKLKNKTGHALRIECVNLITIDVVEENESFSKEESQIRRIEYLWITKTQRKTIDAKGHYKARIRSHFIYQGNDFVFEKDIAF